MKAFCALLLAAACGMTFTGCVAAGGKCQVMARSVPQPVSCTPYVYDGSGNVVKTTPQEVIRHVTYSKYLWAMFWTRVPLNDVNWDISTNLNQMLQKTSGDAVVNVTVTAAGCDPFDTFLSIFLPVVPSYGRVTVQGDIVRISQNRP